MKKWVIKAIVQKVISFLPFSNHINFFFQKYVTKGLALKDEFFYDRLGHAKDHLNSYLKYSDSNIPRYCLELGTGWYPIVPISYYLAGCDKIYTVDRIKLMTKSSLKKTLEKFVAVNNDGLLINYIPLKDERLQLVLNMISCMDSYSMDYCLGILNINYIDCDARNLPLSDNSIDLISSNNTFEHLPIDVLREVLQQFKRIANTESGIMSHSIDLSDHFAHFDKSISTFNFLKFSDRQWKWIDNNIQSLNRLRYNDYVSIFKELNILVIKEKLIKGNLNELKKVKLASKYINLDTDTLSLSACNFIFDMRSET